jgi:8-hydroxy-5-deazaflavin:NADPH oxidoreductase
MSSRPGLAPMTIGVLGGTGDQGRGLARRLAAVGHTIVIGSRSAERAQEAAESLTKRARRSQITGGTNAEAAIKGDIVIVVVPYEGHRELLASLADELAGKIVVDCVNPTLFDKLGVTMIPVPDGSSAEEAAAVLPRSRIVSAFHDVSARRLLGTNLSVSTDVLVCGDDKEAKDLVCELASQIRGIRGIDAGPLRLANVLESLTAVLIGINRRYKTHSGVRITGV